MSKHKSPKPPVAMATEPARFSWNSSRIHPTRSCDSDTHESDGLRKADRLTESCRSGGCTALSPGPHYRAARHRRCGRKGNSETVRRCADSVSDANSRHIAPSMIANAFTGVWKDFTSHVMVGPFLRRLDQIRVKHQPAKTATLSGVSTVRDSH
jgi:hypothetical protein